MRATKSSGIEWAEEIPEDWDVKPLFAVGSESRASNAGGKSENLLSLSFGEVVEKDINSSDGLLPESFDTYQVIKPNDIVFRFTDLQNDKRSLRSALSKHSGIITSAYMAFTPHDCEPRFLAYLMRSYDLTKVFYAMGGGLRQSLKYSDVKRLPIILPPIEEQQAIAEFLDRETNQIDNLIAKQEQLIATLGERRTALIRESISMGIERGPERRWSGVAWLGEIPSHWRAMPLKWCATLQTGSTPRDEEFSEDETTPWLRPDDLDESGAPSRATRYFSVMALDALPSARAGSTLLCGIGATLGKVGFVTEKVYFNQQITAVTSTLNDKFLFYVLHAAREELRALSVGNTMQILNNQRLGSLVVPLPPETEQQVLVAFLDRHTSQIDRLLAASSKTVLLLKERRQALISAAVTGKIDIRQVA